MKASKIQPGKQIRSLVKADGQVEISLVEVETPSPGEQEVVVRIEAAPMNPSDQFHLFAGATAETVSVQRNSDHAALSMRIPEGFFKGMAARIDKPIAAGFEGAGTVVATGTSPEAKSLLGKKVSVFGGSMFSQFRCLPVNQCSVLPDNFSAADGASSFTNPLTALCMLETMKQEGHKAIINTAAASALGQMLIRLCAKDNVPLLNIVRNQESVAQLKSLGAKYVLNSGSHGFHKELVSAIAETGATLAFDAIGGGSIASEILGCMEEALRSTGARMTFYGTAVHKQVYIYGILDTRKTEVKADFGFQWSLGGWYLINRLEKLGPEAVARLRQRVNAELKTTFATSYFKKISLSDVLNPQIVGEIHKRKSGEKFLICPQE